jgi:hypothetical protein
VVELFGHDGGAADVPAQRTLGVQKSQLPVGVQDGLTFSAGLGELFQCVAGRLPDIIARA